MAPVPESQCSPSSEFKALEAQESCGRIWQLRLCSSYSLTLIISSHQYITQCVTDTFKVKKGCNQDSEYNKEIIDPKQGKAGTSGSINFEAFIATRAKLKQGHKMRNKQEHVRSVGYSRIRILFYANKVACS
ncbi:unnamed protein product [Lupinus luteus]|uniref:Uncharacterized protein n=1 Tax=Lupinus luteus TaxID=3873 RepID=A0AAV1XWF8_LUPLU